MKQPPPGYRWVTEGEIIEPIAKVVDDEGNLHPNDSVGHSCYLPETFAMPLAPWELRP